MKNITIKIKLISSFTVVAVLVGFLAAYSLTSINKSSEGFTDYRQMAKNSVLASRVQANMLMVRMNVKDYLKTVSTKDIDEFNSYYEKTNNYIQEAKKDIVHPERKKIIIEVEKDLKLYRENFLIVIDYMNKRNDVVNNNLNVNGKKIEQLLTQVMKTAKRDNDIEASLAVAEGIRTLLLARLYTSKYLGSNSIEDSNRVHKEFKNLSKQLVTIDKNIQNPKRKSQLKQAVDLISKYSKGVNTIEKIITERNLIINDGLNKIGPRIAKESEDIKLSIKKDQDTIGPEVASLNDSINTVITIISIFILLFVIALGIYIPQNISKLINRFQLGLVDFFRYLNKETDNAVLINIDSKDEIGQMSKIVDENITKTKELIEQDNALINDVKRVVEEVKKGKMKQKIAISTQNEALEELKVIFNEMLEVIALNVCEDLNKLQAALESYQKLDFTHKIENDSGKTTEGLNALAVIINEMLVDNKSNGLTLLESSEILLNNVSSLNKNSIEASASLEETAAAIEEITGNIRGTTDNIQMMSVFAKEVTQSANNGEKLATETNSAMDEINNQVTEINEAISVIDQIAFQTNILSLNAAVEAATAGEAGKGFAVVAAEVRNLASRSAEAASEIKNIVEHAKSKADQGKIIADKMIEGYGVLNDNIVKTSESINSITSASKEQLTGIEQINDAINQLDQQTQENVAVANRTNDIAEQTSKIANDIVEDANNKEFIGKETVQAKDLN